MFTRGIRNGDWESYFGALTEMLPYIAWCDNSNYLKLLTLYLSDMRMLSPKIEADFRLGDFSVSRSGRKFANVEPDHAQE